MRVALGVLVAEKTKERDDGLRIREWVELGTFALRKRPVVLIHWIRIRSLGSLAKEESQGEPAEIACQKLGLLTMGLDDISARGFGNLAFPIMVTPDEEKVRIEIDCHGRSKINMRGSVRDGPYQRCNAFTLLPAILLRASNFSLVKVRNVTVHLSK